jgi:hypothetical protein
MLGGEISFPSEEEEWMGLREWVLTFRSYVGTIPGQCITVLSPWSMTLDALVRVPSETILSRRRMSEGRPLRETEGRIALLVGWSEHSPFSQ